MNLSIQDLAAIIVPMSALLGFFYKGIDKRFKSIDDRFNKIDDRFNKID